MISIPGYRIVDTLGSGGMAIVYRAEEEKLGRTVAIKVLLEHFSLDEEFRKRFFNEARVMARLSHPNLVTLIDYIEFGERLALVMEFVDGKTLDKVIGEEVGPIPWEKALPVFRQVLHGASYAHRRGIVHRDLKPSNVIMSDEGHAKITDFGIAKIAGEKGLTRTGIRKPGTLLYMAPEVVQGSSASPASDVYSLGMTLYEMLSGNMPLEGSDTSELNMMLRIVKQELPDPREFYPHIPQWLVDIVSRCVAKDPSRRYSTCAELEQALDAGAEGEGVAPVAASAAKANPDQSNRRGVMSRLPKWLLPAAGGAAAVAVVLALVLGGGDGEEPAEEAPPPPPDPRLVVADSIPCGPYFQDISKAAYDSRGNIVVMDEDRNEVNVFTGAGEYLRGFDLAGSEEESLQLPTGIAMMPGGGTAISDWGIGGVMFFDSTCKWQRTLEGFGVLPPRGIEPVEEGAMAGLDLYMEDRSHAGYRVCVWRDTEEPDKVINVYLSEFDAASDTSRLRVYQDVPLMAVSSEGRIFTALPRPDSTVISGFDPSGNLFFQETVAGGPLPRTQMDIREEMEQVSRLFDVDVEDTSWRPDSLLPVVRSLGVDSLGRIWLGISAAGLADYMVMDQNGEVLFDLQLDDPRLEGCEIRIDPNGITAYPAYSSQRQMVYMLEFADDPALESTQAASAGVGAAGSSASSG